MVRWYRRKPRLAFVNMTSTAYGLPNAIPRCIDFIVCIDGHLAAVGDTPVAGYAVCAIDGPSEIEIAASKLTAGAVVRPVVRGLPCTAKGQRLRIQVDRPGAITVEIPGLKPLHIFIQDLASADPPPGVRVKRLEAGRVHELGETRLGDGETLFIEGGAVLRGWLRAGLASDVRVCGHGVIDGSIFPHHWRQSLAFESCRNLTIEGVTVVGSPSWTVLLAGCDHVVVRRINLLGWVVCSDGIDVVGSRDVVIEDCFLRDNDDCVAVKSLAIEGMAPAIMRDVERVLVQRCVCWNDHAGNVFEIGFETRCESIRGITFRDCDVIGAHGEGGIFTIHAGDRAEISEVLYENIRIEHMYDKFIDLRVLHSRYSLDANRGRIHSVTLRRIRACADPFNTISLIGGFDAQHLVSDIRLEDVRIGDKTLGSLDDLHLFTRHACGIAVAGSCANPNGLS